MVSLRLEEEEPMLPTTVSEKGALIMDMEPRPIASSQSSSFSSKMGVFKKLLIAVALMMMGASILRAFERYPNMRHNPYRLGSGDNADFTLHHGKGPDDGDHIPPPHHGPHRGPEGPRPPHHGPPHGGPGGPGGPHGPGKPMIHPPRPVECFKLEKDEAVNFTLTIRHPGQAVFLDKSLDGSKIALETEALPKGEEPEETREGPPPPPPGRGPPKGPEHGPGPHKKHDCHGKPSTLMVSVNSIEEEKKFITAEGNKTKEVFVCSLDLPFGAVGLGLFHDDPKDREHHEDDKKMGDMKKKEPKEPKEPKQPKAPKPFAPVAVKISFPAGQPFTVTSQFPRPPPHFRFPHHGGPPKHWKSWLHFWKPKHSDGEERHAMPKVSSSTPN